MGCFTLQWLQQVLIYCVVIGAVYAIVKLIIPFALQKMPAIVGQIIDIIMWAIIAIIMIYICFALIACLLSLGGGLGSLMPPGHR